MVAVSFHQFPIGALILMLLVIITLYANAEATNKSGLA